MRKAEVPGPPDKALEDGKEAPTARKCSPLPPPVPVGKGLYCSADRGYYPSLPHLCFWLKN